MATAGTFSVDPFWPHLEREKSHVIRTQRRHFYKALRELKDSVEKVRPSTLSLSLLTSHTQLSPITQTDR